MGWVRTETAELFTLELVFGQPENYQRPKKNIPWSKWTVHISYNIVIHGENKISVDNQAKDSLVIRGIYYLL